MKSSSKDFNYDFRIDFRTNSQPEITFSDVHSLHEFEWRDGTFYVYGEVYGFFEDDDTARPITQYRNRQRFSRMSWQKITSAVIGPVVLIFRSELDLLVVISTSHPGLYNFMGDRFVEWYSNEEVVYLKTPLELDEVAFMHALKAHHGLRRLPGKELNSNITRIFCGQFLSVNSSGLSIPRFYLLDPEFLGEDDEKRSSKAERSEVLLNRLATCIELYADRWGGSLSLALSGGLDSCTLLALARESNTELNPFHIGYNIEQNPCEWGTAKFIASALGYKCDLEPLNTLIENHVLDVDLFSKSKIGTTSTLPSKGLNYLSLPIDQISGMKVMISGQNADSLYMIDSFAPSTHEDLVNSFLKRFLAIFKRILFWAPYLQLQLFLNKLLNPGDFGGRIFVETYLKNFYLPVSEHVLPIRNENPVLFPKNARLESAYREYKFSVVANLIDEYLSYRTDKTNNSKYKFNGCDLAFLLKMVKWIKFIQNVPTNYNALEKSTNVKRILPFSEAPVVKNLLTRKLYFEDLFFNKKVFVDYLRCKLGKPFHKVVKRKEFKIIKTIKRLVFLISPSFAGSLKRVVRQATGNSEQQRFQASSEFWCELENSLNELDLHSSSVNELQHSTRIMREKKTLSKDDSMFLLRLSEFIALKKNLC